MQYVNHLSSLSSFLELSSVQFVNSEEVEVGEFEIIYEDQVH